MIAVLVNWFVSALVVLGAAYLLPGVHIQSFTTALVAAVVLGIINALVKPFLILLTLPITLITLGLFTFVLNALVIQMTGALVPGFQVDSFGWALLYSLVLSIFGGAVNRLFQTRVGV